MHVIEVEGSEEGLKAVYGRRIEEEKDRRVDIEDRGRKLCFWKLDLESSIGGPRAVRVGLLARIRGRKNSCYSFRT